MWYVPLGTWVNMCVLITLVVASAKCHSPPPIDLLRAGITYTYKFFEEPKRRVEGMV